MEPKCRNICKSCGLRYVCDISTVKRTSKQAERTADGSRVRTGRSGGQRARAPFRVAAGGMPADNTSHGATAPTDGALWRCPSCHAECRTSWLNPVECGECNVLMVRVSG